ncbi:hypothetical protein [Microbacterium sp. NPDC087589]|uniref:hypothetical protein n=1 Tax=Microbacterium sp. NPDC087589 TaxID=3364191 RepID=UPI00380B4B99
MTPTTDSVGAQSRILLRALDITVETDGQLGGDIARTREAAEALLSESAGGPYSARLRAALRVGEHNVLSRRDQDALAVVHNRLLV